MLAYAEPGQKQPEANSKAACCLISLSVQAGGPGLPQCSSASTACQLVQPQENSWPCLWDLTGRGMRGLLDAKQQPPDAHHQASTFSGCHTAKSWRQSALDHYCGTMPAMTDGSPFSVVGQADFRKCSWDHVWDQPAPECWWLVPARLASALPSPLPRQTPMSAAGVTCGASELQPLCGSGPSTADTSTGARPLLVLFHQSGQLRHLQRDSALLLLLKLPHADGSSSLQAAMVCLVCQQVT